MTVDASVAAGATESIRAAVDAELPPDAWATVADLVQRIDRAIDLGDGPSVARLTAELDGIRARAGRSAPAPVAPAEGRRRARVVVVLTVLVVIVVTAALVLAGGGDDDDPVGADSSTPFTRDEATTTFADETTTTEEGDDTTTTFSDETTISTTVPVPSVTAAPPTTVVGAVNDLGTLELGEDGELTIELVWASGADLDLAVVEPDGRLLSLDRPGPSLTGGEHTGHLDADCASSGELRGEAVEWPDGGAFEGPYEVFVDGFEVDGCGSGAYILRIDTEEDDLELNGDVTTGERDVFEFDAEVETTVVPSTTPDEASGGGGADEGDSNAAGLAAIAFGAALLAGATTWVVWRWRRPADAGAAAQPVAATSVRRQLPAPDELRDLANHTIHRLLEAGST